MAVVLCVLAYPLPGLLAYVAVRHLFRLATTDMSRAEHGCLAVCLVAGWPLLVVLALMFAASWVSDVAVDWWCHWRRERERERQEEKASGG